MIGHKFRAAAAVLAATSALIGCSADHAPQSGSGGAKDGSMSFNLLASPNVQIGSIGYNVATQGGTAVVNGSIPVPDDQSQHVPVLGVQSLSSGDYTLVLSATGTLPDGSSVPCTSPTTGFHVTSGSNTFIGDIPLTCSITTQSDTSGSATADVSVTTVTTTQGSVIETFAYGPRTVNGKTVGGACTFPPVAINIANANTAIAYSWAASPDGTFTLNSANTQGTYNCASPGSKTLTVTGTLAGQTSTKSVTVTCAPCGVCGNGLLEPGEQCDDTTPRCQACQIVAVCGDNFIDAPETCDPPNGTTCDTTCHLIVSGTGGTGGGAGAGGSGGAAAGAGGSGGAAAGAGGSGGAAAGAGGSGGAAAGAGGSGGAAAGSGGTGGGDKFTTLCQPCIATSADGDPQATYCAPSAECMAVEKCVVNAVCFNPLPAFCYCGTTDVTACDAATFVPTGPCHTEIRAGEPTAASNDDALNQLFDFTVPTGVAMDILNDVNANVPACQSACF